MKELKQAFEVEIESRQNRILFDECRELRFGGYSQYDREYAFNSAKDELIDDLRGVFKEEKPLLILEKLIESVKQ